MLGGLPFCTCTSDMSRSTLFPTGCNPESFITFVERLLDFKYTVHFDITSANIIARHASSDMSLNELCDGVKVPVTVSLE